VPPHGTFIEDAAQSRQHHCLLSSVHRYPLK
jgi:hypothetical protein